MNFWEILGKFGKIWQLINYFSYLNLNFEESMEKFWENSKKFWEKLTKNEEIYKKKMFKIL